MVALSPAILDDTADWFVVREPYIRPEKTVEELRWKLQTWEAEPRAGRFVHVVITYTVYNADYESIEIRVSEMRFEDRNDAAMYRLIVC